MIVKFQQVIDEELSLEEAHNNVRRMLYNQSPSLFQYGTLGTNIQDLIQNIFRDTESLSTSKSSCMHCGFEDYSQSQLSRITYTVCKKDIPKVFQTGLKPNSPKKRNVNNVTYLWILLKHSTILLI